MNSKQPWDQLTQYWHTYKPVYTPTHSHTKATQRHIWPDTTTQRDKHPQTHMDPPAPTWTHHWMWWNSVEQPGIPWNGLELSGMSWKVIEGHGRWQNVTSVMEGGRMSQCDKMWQNLVECCRRSWNVVEHEGTVWKAMEHYGMPWQLMGTSPFCIFSNVNCRY